MFKLHKVSDTEWNMEVDLPADFPYRDEVMLHAAAEQWLDKNWPDDAEGVGGDDGFDLCDAVKERFGILREAPGERVAESKFFEITREFDIKAARKALRKMGATIKWSNGVSYIADRKWETA